MMVKIDHDAYVKFLGEEINVVPGKYTRAQLLALATAQLDVPAARLAPMFPNLKLTGTAEVIKAPTPAPETESLPWDEDAGDAADAEAAAVDDKQMLEALKDITWSQSEAPRGKPGLRHVFEVLAWLKGDNKRILAVHAALLGDEFVKKPKPAKDLKALADAVGRMPVWDTARWLFTVWVEHVSREAFSAAWDGKGIDALVNELWAFGLDMDGPRLGTEVWRRADQHSFMPLIIDGTRTDGVHKKRGSCAGVMRALKIACDTLPADKHAQMHDHIIKNYATDTTKAFAPLTKILVSKGHEDQSRLIQFLVASGDVPVATLAMVFQGEWDRLYTNLRSCLDTVGPIPPWLNASAA